MYWLILVSMGFSIAHCFYWVFLVLLGFGICAVRVNFTGGWTYAKRLRITLGKTEPCHINRKILLRLIATIILIFHSSYHCFSTRQSKSQSYSSYVVFWIKKILYYRIFLIYFIAPCDELDVTELMARYSLTITGNCL